MRDRQSGYRSGYAWIKRWIGAIGALGLACSLMACSLPQVKAEDRLFQNIQLEFLGETIVPKTTEVDKMPVGGLSGITYSPKEDVFYAVSDDRSEKAPARFYQLKLKLDKTGKPLQTKFTAVTTLKDESGQVYAKGTVDPEGIAITPQGTVWVSSEGVAASDIPPFVNEYEIKSGKLLRSLRIPEQYIPRSEAPALNHQDRNSKDIKNQNTDQNVNPNIDPKEIPQKEQPKPKRLGIQNNMGFESLTLSANAARLGVTEPYRLFTAAENALEQDKNPDPDSIEGDRVRFMHYSLQDRRIDLVAEYLYPLEPKPMGTEKFGLVEMLSLDGAGRFLSLERSFGLSGFKVQLFQTVFAGSKDTSMLPSIQGLDTIVKPAQKQLVENLNNLDLVLDNLEGMTLGPRLPDGSQSLIMVSDDNFNKLQKTQLLVFRIKGLKI